LKADRCLSIVYYQERFKISIELSIVQSTSALCKHLQKKQKLRKLLSN
jgi:hypothetical protein